MCAALFLNFHGSQGLSAPLQRARSPEDLQHSGCYHRVDRNMIHFTYRHFQRDYSCRVHGALSVSHRLLLWQARAPHRRIAPASASCDANLSAAIISHGTGGCQHITNILLISVYPFILCIFRARGKAAPPSRESRWDPPAHLWSARTGSRPAAFWRLINSNFVPNTVLAPTFLLPDSAGGRAFARPPFSLLLLCFVRRQPTTLPVLSELPLYVPFVTPLQPSNMT